MQQPANACKTAVLPEPDVQSANRADADDAFRSDVIRGLSNDPKTLPCKYLYDAAGSQIFDDICELPEYYPTRCEADLMRQHGDDIVRHILGRVNVNGDEAASSHSPNSSRANPSGMIEQLRLIELGSGSSIKTRILLDRLLHLPQYVPVDISAEHLQAAADELISEYPQLDVQPLAADFTQSLDFAALPGDPDHVLVYFPGSTIGNFTPDFAVDWLGQLRQWINGRGQLLIGFDLDKSSDVLEAAYDDAQGVTAAFNLNLLRRINRELDADFKLDSFQHRAIYNADLRRVEMHLISLIDQTVRVGSKTFQFAAGESIHTENSHKYRREDMARMLHQAGWRCDEFWTDRSSKFGVMLATCSPEVRVPEVEDRRQILAKQFDRVRAASLVIASPLSTEDQMIQSMPCASPTRWHLAHTSWFFETFLLKPQSWYQTPDTQFERLFNSYYNGVGEPFPQDRRGLISRPTVAEVHAYRKHVDEAMHRWIRDTPLDSDDLDTLEIGLHHEQQHQELMITDIKHAMSLNPLDPIVDVGLAETPTHEPLAANEASPESWIAFEECLTRVGHDGRGFYFDNELPRHRVWLDAYELQTGLVSNQRWLEFMEDGGYETPSLWLSLGWKWVSEQRISHPLYWRRGQDGWQQYTLGGVQPIEPTSPVRHVSYFEADAFARWSGCVLPTEAQWEHAATTATDQLHNLKGQVWQWTSSPYTAYPGYRPAKGTLGEYNGKFMCNVFVLRGGSSATATDHTRWTYRNFFEPTARWQFTGLRLARYR